MFFVFGFNDGSSSNRPNGGADDLVGRFDSLDEAKQSVRLNQLNHDYMHIADDNLKVIFRD